MYEGRDRRQRTDNDMKQGGKAAICVFVLIIGLTLPTSVVRMEKDKIEEERSKAALSSVQAVQDCSIVPRTVKHEKVVGNEPCVVIKNVHRKSNSSKIHCPGRSYVF